MVTFETHKFGACARRFPDLLRDLVKQEREMQDKVPAIFDPARARILIDSQCDEFREMATYDWRQ